MRCKECGQTNRGPRKELRDVQLCGDCYSSLILKKKNEIETSERYKNWQRKKEDRMRRIEATLPDEDNLDARLDRIESSKPKQDEIPRSEKLQRFEKALERPTKELFQSNIESLCWDIIKKHNSKTRTSDHNIELMDDLIELYKELRSLKKVSEVTGKSVYTLQQGFKNPIRLPDELRELLNNGKLATDPIMASAIAFYVTDLYEWDGEREKESTVVNTCKEVVKMMKENLEMRREFFATKDDYSKPVSHSSERRNEIQEISSDYSIKFSEPWEWGDRTGKQYNAIIFSKNVDAIRFLKRWEYENKRRIPKKLAYEIIHQLMDKGNIKEFLQDHENEFQD